MVGSVARRLDVGGTTEVAASLGVVRVPQNNKSCSRGFGLRGFLKDVREWSPVNPTRMKIYQRVADFLDNSARQPCSFKEHPLA